MTTQKPRLKMVRVVSESGQTTYCLLDNKKHRWCSACREWKERGCFYAGTGFCKQCRTDRQRVHARKRFQEKYRRETSTEPKSRPAYAALDLTTGFGVYLVQFLDAKATLSPKTLISYRNELSMFARHIGNRWPFTADDINSFLASKKAAGRGMSTITTYYRAINNFSTWLVKRQKLDTNPMDMAERPPNAKPLPRAPQKEDIQVLFSWIQRRVGRGEWRGIRDVALFSLMIDTGLRVGEVSRLKLGDIDLTRRIVTLRNTKTRSDGTSVFGLGAAANLAAWLEARGKLELPADLKNCLFVGFVRGKWLNLSENGIRQFLARCCREQDLPHLTPHQLRHGCAVFSLQAGANIIDVQKQLRHRTAQMTLRYLMMADEGREERHLEYSPFDKALGGAL